MKDRVIRPGATIGILGGGQLGRMIVLAGRAMGYRFATLDPTPDAPGGQVSDLQIKADFDDQAAALRLAEMSDVVTYEFENVDAQVAAVLEEKSFVPQGSRLLRISQNRILEKTSIQSFDLPVAPFRAVSTLPELQAAVQELGLPAVLKTTTGGYDGKGQYVLRHEQQLPEAFSSLEKFGTELIVEKFIPFEKEVSVIVARNLSGAMETFPVSENIHVENILHMSIVPARISSETQRRAEQIARRIAERLELVGLLAVEMFVTAEGGLYVNEMAPRPHNSGHYTMEACMTSQFEQHVRAVCNLPLGSTALLSPVVMVNILGEHLQAVLDRIGQFPKVVKVHIYGKSEAKDKRKMGHLNVLAESTEEALSIVRSLGIWKPQP